MRILLLSATLSFVCVVASGQDRLPFTLRYNHQALLVRNLDTSGMFYGKVLGLPEIENKTKNPGIRWFSLGDGKELHLIAGDTKPVVVLRSIHLALTASDFDGFVRHLNERKILYFDFSGAERTLGVRADGVHQVYFQDPDGYWIEVNDVKP